MVISGILYSYIGFEISVSWAYILVVAALGAVETLLLYNMSRLRSTQFTCWVLVQVVGIAISMVFFVWNGPKF